MGGSQSILTRFNREQLIPVYHSPDAKVIRTRCRKPIKPPPKSAQKIELHAELMQGQNDSMISAIDGRTQVFETAKWPNSAHGVIAFKMNNIGVGIMIGPQIVLTAGSNLYDIETKTYVDAKNMQFLPGMNGNMAPFGVIEVERHFVSPNYIKEGRDDYGILILKKPIGDETGYFGLACLESEEIEEENKTNVAEYPGDKIKDKPSISNISEREGETSTIYKTQGSLNFSIGMYTGQNGNGVWYKEGEHYYVCGINRAENAATLLTRDIYKQIYTWIGDAGLSELLFKSRELFFTSQTINANFVAFLIKEDFNDLITLNLCFAKIGSRELEKLARNTSWMNLSELVLRESKIDAEGAKALAQNTSWTNLSKLNLYYNKIGAEGAKALAQNTSWANLSELCLIGNNIGSEGAKELARNTSWVNLSQLHLEQNYIEAEGGKGLGQNTSWVNLSVLNLGGNNIGAEGGKGLGQNTSWVNLSQLVLYNNNIGSEGAKGLAQNTSWVNLSVLTLGNNNIGAEGVKALAQNASWINLSRLFLNRNNIDAEGAKALAQNTSWTNLSVLNLHFTNPGEQGVKALAKNPTWIRLTDLDLSDCHLDCRAGEELAKNESWINLSKLNLRENNLGSEGVKALAENISWTKLTELDLRGNKICEKGVKALAENTSWINLSDLKLLCNRVDREGVDVIKENKVWGQKFNFAEFDVEEKVEEVEDERENIRYWKG